MTPEFFNALLTIAGSGIAAWAGVRAQIWWIVKTLDRHEKYHENHFETFEEILARKNIYAKR